MKFEMGKGVVSKQRNKMEMDRLLSKWSALAKEHDQYWESSKFRAIRNVFKELSLRDNLDESARKHILEVNLRGNHKELQKNRLDDLDLELLVQALEELNTSSSVVLDLQFNRISNAGMESLSKYLERSACPVHSLDLGCNDLTEEGASRLCQAMHLNSSVQHLALRGNKIGHQGGLQVAAMLQVNQTLQSLDMANTDASTDVIIAMATVLRFNKYLESVDLSRPLLHSCREETAVHIAEMLRVNSHLTSLRLAKHGMTDSAVSVLCKSLRENSSLTLLDLSSNKLSRDGARLLADLLSTNPPLKVLELSCNRIEDEGLDYISNTLGSSNMTLRRLYVGYNNISDASLHRLAAAVEHNYALTHLAIWGNDTGVETSKAFQKLLQSGRMNPQDVDVEPYTVDNVSYLAKLDTPPL